MSTVGFKATGMTHCQPSFRLPHSPACFTACWPFQSLLSRAAAGQLRQLAELALQTEVCDS